MRQRIGKLVAVVIVAWMVSICGCGLAYQNLRNGTVMYVVTLSYAISSFYNDIAATVIYTSTKSGDEGKFLDLKFSDGKLVSWAENEHTMPAKQGAGFSYGFGPGGAVSPVQHY